MKKVLLGIIIGMAICSYLPNLFAGEPVYKYYEITVASGDTLWDIAEQNAEKGADIHEEIFKICEANKLQNKKIYPGQVLKIPVKVEVQEHRLARK